MDRPERPKYQYVPCPGPGFCRDTLSEPNAVPDSAHFPPHLSPHAPRGADPRPVPLVILGGGGHALVVAEAALLADQPVPGFLDDNPAAPLGAILIDLPHPFAAPAHLGPLADFGPLAGRHWIVGLGDLRHRRAVLGMAAKMKAHDAGARSVIHPRAWVSPSALVGPGVYIGPGAIVHSRARIGAHAIINTGAIVEHDCVIGENSHIAPGTALGGTVTVGSDTLVGIGSRVLPGARIGQGCVVGAGAVVLGGVADGGCVVGVPAGPLPGG